MAEKNARDIILGTALTLFSQKGFDAVSVREIAKKSGQNVSMISYYFGSKEGLYKEIISEHMTKTTNQIKAIFASEKKSSMTRESFRNEIKSLVSIMTDLKLNNHEMVALMQREKVDGLPYAREVQEKLVVPVAKQIEDVFKEAQKNKIIRSGFEPSVYITLLIESVHGFLTTKDCRLNFLKGAYSFPKQKDEFIEFVTTVFTEGIMK